LENIAAIAAMKKFGLFGQYQEEYLDVFTA
jgi:hypothetical protein